MALEEPIIGPMASMACMLLLAPMALLLPVIVVASMAPMALMASIAPRGLLARMASMIPNAPVFPVGSYGLYGASCSYGFHAPVARVILIASKAPRALMASYDAGGSYGATGFNQEPGASAASMALVAS